MPFSEKSLDFLFENRQRNDKNWFHNHKDIYEKEVAAPFGEIIEFLTPLMEEIDSKIVCNPKKFSRIYRDTRFAKGGEIFRDSMWASLRRPKVERFVSPPEFYFYISPEGFGWGCGYYSTPAKVMEAMRELIISDDETAVNALNTYKELTDFHLEGQLYKRNKFPEQSEEKCLWCNRKSICVCLDSQDAELLFSDNFKHILKRDFRRLSPIYQLYIKAEENAVK